MGQRRRPFSLVTNLLGGGAAATPPTCVITCDQTSPSSALSFTFTYTWSEDVTGFEVGDAGIANGTKGTFTAVSGSVYTLAVVPNALADVTATVAAGVCVNGVGTSNTEATPLVIASSLAVYDTFTDTNGTLLTAHTPDFAPAATTWATAGTSHQIAGNKAAPEAGNQARRNSIDTTLADCTITCTIVTGQTDSATAEYDSVLVRVTDAQNEWQIIVSKDPTYKFSIVERTSNVATVRAIDAGFTYAANTTYNITVVLSGNDITASITGGYSGTLNYSSAVRNTVTKHGMSSYIATTVTNYNTFDNFRVAENP